jgi:tol-pal system protein YbgF
MKRLAPFFLGMFFLAGCATQQDLNAVKWEVDALKTRVAKAEDKLKEKERLTEQGLGNQAELLAHYGELKEQVASLQGSVDEMKVSSRGAVKEDRLVALEREIMDLKALIDAQKEPPKSLYETGLEKYRAGRFAEAVSDLKSYLASGPDADLADDAQFWIGESLFSLEKYEDAVLQYDMVAKKYSKGDKVPEALLKEGISFYKMGDSQTGNLVLQRLVQGYPGTEAATKAKKIIKDGLPKG